MVAYVVDSFGFIVEIMTALNQVCATRYSNLLLNPFQASKDDTATTLD